MLLGVYIYVYMYISLCVCKVKFKLACGDVCGTTTPPDPKGWGENGLSCEEAGFFPLKRKKIQCQNIFELDNVMETPKYLVCLQ